MPRLQDKIMLITGAGSGLGREVALLASSEGATVVVTDKVEARIGPVVDLVRAAGGTASGMRVDVSIEAEVEAGVAHAVDTYGRLDILHANAGVTVPGRGSIPFVDTTLENWNTVNDVNFTGVFLSMKHAARAMSRTGGGSIVVTSSAAAFVAYPGYIAYGAGKAGVNGLVRSAAFDLGHLGIRVNAVCPTHGMSANFAMEPDAEVLGKSFEEVRGPWIPEKAVMPLKLPTPPVLRDNAWPVVFLASDEARYISGNCLSTADGGQHARVSIPFPPRWSLDAPTTAS